MKLSKVTSRWFYLRSGHGSILLRENDQVNFRYSRILENWIDIYIDDQYKGTIPEAEFKTNFRLDNLLMLGSSSLA